MVGVSYAVAMGTRTSTKSTPVSAEEVEASAERLAAEIEEQGALSNKEIGARVPKAAVAKVIERLEERGLERTKSGVRRPLAAQLEAALADGAFIALRDAAAHLRGATKAEAVKTADALVRAGGARLVLRTKEKALVPPTVDVLSDDELGQLAKLAADLKTLTGLAQKAPRATLLRQDVKQLFEPFVRGRTARLLSEIADLQDPVVRMTSVPALVRKLAPALRAPEVHDALLEEARRGRLELRPESGMGRLSVEDARLCVPGPEGSMLSWIRVIEQEARP
jgi:hypothetical protein